MNEEIILDKFAKRLSNLIKEYNTDINILANKLGIKSKSTIYRYMNAEMAPKITTVKYLAEIYNVNTLWLMGYDVPMKAIPIKDIKQTRIPILGTVKAGYDYLAEENKIGYTYLDYTPSDPENYYALQITGNSMEPLFDDGDIAIIHRQDDFESGNTCIILINGDEATVKKVVRMEDGIDLIAMNPYYPVRHFSNEDMKKIPVQVIGKVVEARKRNQFK
ncbi:MAG: helix-turn-helix domain-containing protein [Clostridia bacterium]|nr:helix-turn-helix domain-containing protein [Clostridia bacterium]